MTRPDQYRATGNPVRIGLLIDTPPRFADHAERIYDMVAERYQRDGRLDRGVEFVKLYPWGPPAGFIQNSIDAFHELCDQGCIAVLGGNHADDTIAMAPHADARRVPFLGMGATAQGMSEWAFSICWSSIPHDVYTMGSWLRQKGYKSVVMTWDRADHALENVIHFRNACARGGIRILADVRLPQLVVPDLQDQFRAAHRELAAIGADALVHFGTGAMSTHWARYVTESWDIPRVMNDAFHGATNADLIAGYEGWVGTTMWDDENPLSVQFLDDYMARHPEVERPSNEMAGLFRDAITALLEGVALAPILTPDGVRRGLERVQMLPSASGGARTCISFSRHAHRGLQGADIMVLRRVSQGELVMEGRIEMF